MGQLGKAMHASTTGFALTWILVALLGAWAILAAGKLLDQTATLGWSPVECTRLPARDDVLENNLRIRNPNLTDLSILVIITDPPSLDSSQPSIFFRLGPDSAREVLLELSPAELLGAEVQGVQRELEADVTTVDPNGLVLSYQVTCSSSPAADPAG
jgi:hypothetical protein